VDQLRNTAVRQLTGTTCICQDRLMTSLQEPIQTEDAAFFLRTKPIELSEDVRTSYFGSSQHVGGAWQNDELHMAPVSGLVAAELEAYQARGDFITTLLSFGILGKRHAGDLK